MAYRFSVNRGGGHSADYIPPDLVEFISEEILRAKGVPKGTRFKLLIRTPRKDRRKVGWRLLDKSASGVCVEVKTPNADHGLAMVIQPNHTSIDADDLYAYLSHTRDNDDRPKEEEGSNISKKEEKKKVNHRIPGDRQNLKGAAQDEKDRRAVLRQFRPDKNISTDMAREIVRAALNVSSDTDPRSLGRFLGELAKLDYLEQIRSGRRPQAYRITDKGLAEVMAERIISEEETTGLPVLSPEDKDSISILLLALSESEEYSRPITFSRAIQVCRKELGSVYSEKTVTDTLECLAEIGYLSLRRNDVKSGIEAVEITLKGKRLIEDTEIPRKTAEPRARQETAKPEPKVKRGVVAVSAIEAAKEEIQRGLEEATREGEALLREYQSKADSLEKKRNKLKEVLEVLEAL